MGLHEEESPAEDDRFWGDVGNSEADVEERPDGELGAVRLRHQLRFKYESAQAYVLYQSREALTISEEMSR